MKLEHSMEHSALGNSRKQDDEAEFNLREWALKAQTTREKTNISRRYSASYIRSFREDNAKSFRSNVSFSSTASSPGYTLKEEINPSTYSFTTALKALQAKTMYSWEYMSPDGLTLHSKWNEAERYICNPLSGEVPLECLSTKILSGRSFRQSNSRITISAPFNGQFQTKQHVKSSLAIHEAQIQIPSKEKKEVSITRDVETQNISANYISSSSPSPAPTPSIEERSIKLSEEAADCLPMSTPSIKERSIKEVDAGDHSSMTTPTQKSEELEVEVKETAGGKEETKRNEELGQRVKQMYISGNRCLSWRSLWMRITRQRERHKSTNNNIFLCHINGCYKE